MRPSPYRARRRMSDWRHLPGLRSLRIFEAAARHLNYSHAAAELHLTHGAVSHQVKALETLLGTAEKLGPAAEPLALIIAPTRELALQVQRELAWLYAQTGARVISCVGGMDPRREAMLLDEGAHIVVGTPGRVQKHLDKESLSLDSLNIWVLDEADRMLDMGFADAMREIAKGCPRQRQTLLFSATYPDDIQKLSAEFQRSPLSVRVESTHSAHQIEQRFFELPNQEAKFPALIKLLQHYQPRSAVIFCNIQL